MLVAEEFFPYPSFRPGQREVLERIRIESRSHGLIILRAPTGFGKTAIGISTGMMISPAIHSVRTRNEITPVLRDLKKLSERVRGVRFSFIHSAHAMCPLLMGRSIDPEDFWLNCQILRDMGLCTYYTRAQSIDESDVEDILERAENHVDAVRRISRDLGACPFFSLARLARGSEYVVATYPYVFSRDLFSTVFEDEPSSYSVIIDEAHMLTDPSAIFSSEISISRIRGSINEVREYLGGDPYLEDLLDRIARITENKARDERLRKIDRSELGLDSEAIDHIIDTALEVKRRAIGRILSGGDVSRAASKRISLVKVALSIAMLEDSRFEAFAYIDPQSAWLKISAVDHSVISEALGVYRFSLLMSGTPPSLDYVERILGVKEPSYIDALELGAWSPYRNMAVVLASELTSRYSERADPMYSLYARYIDEIDNHLDGVKLIIYPSYRFMLKVVEKLGGRGYVENRRTTIEDLLGGIEKNSLVHAVAGGKLSEGIEITESGRSLIRCVFIAGVPYPQRDDYMDEIMRTMRRKASEKEVWDYVYNMSASIRAMQAIGRAVRSEDDIALVVLGDRRFMAADLRKYMGLSIGRIVRNIGEFRELIRMFNSI
jgi:DNA excision repair protein ERCC-2